MAVPLTKLSWWWWGGNGNGKGKEQVSARNSLPDLSFDLKEPESLNFTSMRGTKMASSSRKIKRKWQSREERKIDKEYDVVLVPSDGGDCLSGSESDDSDWSIGWLEPHAPHFENDDEGDDSFAVLVPCYKLDGQESEEGEPSNQFLNAVRNLPNEYSSEGKKYMEQWLSSLQNF